MISSALNEIRSIEQVLEKIIGSSEQFFLQMGQQLNSCRSKTADIGKIEAIVSAEQSAKQLSLLEPDLQILKTGFYARNQSIDFTLQQTLETLKQCMQYDVQIDHHLQDLPHLPELNLITESNAPSAEEKLQTDENQPQFSHSHLREMQERLHRHARKSSQTFEQLQRKTEIQHGILLNDAEAFSLCDANKDQHVTEKDRLANQDKFINKQINELVSWLQVDDISRQKVEHVNQALADLRSELEPLVQPDSSENQTSVDFLLAEVCRLQAAHLNFAKDELSQAEKQICDIYSSIESSCENVVAIVHTIQRSFSLREGTGLARLDFLLEQFHDGLAFNGVAFGVLDDCQTILQQEMKTFTDTRERLNQEVIALQHSCTDQTKNGSALMTDIIKNVSQTSERPLELMQALADTFHEVVEDCELFCNTTQRLKDGAVTSVADLREQSKSAREKIRNTMQNVYRESNAVAQDIDTLRSDLHHSSKALSGLQETLQMMNDATTKLEQLSAKGNDLQTSDLNDNIRGILDRLTSRYTMLSERQTHSDVTSDGKNLKKEHSADNSDSIFGANIELF